MSSEQQQPGQLSWDSGEERGCVRPEDCDCILRLVWRREGPPGLQTKSITSAAPAHRQSRRAVKRRQHQSDGPQWNKKKTRHFPSPQLLTLHIETKQTTMKTED